MPIGFTYCYMRVAEGEIILNRCGDFDDLNSVPVVIVSEGQCLEVQVQTLVFVLAGRQLGLTLNCRSEVS